MSNRRQALSRARQYRTCPPARVALDKRNAENFNRHCAVCPHCSGRAQGSSDSWEKLAFRISQSTSQKPVEKKSISAGLLYYLKPERACWRGNYYYNPPMVLVLAYSQGMDDAVTVAQTYHEICLAGPGDLILYDNQTGCGDLFVECWHTCTLGVDDLGPPVGKVSDEALKAVSAAGENSENMPSWAPLTMPLTDQDPRIYFRELEVECLFTFGAPAAASLINQLEKPSIHILDRSVQELKTELGRKEPCLRWPVEPQTMEQVLALSRYPDEMLPLAADTDDITRFQVKLIHISQGRVENICLLIAEILLKQETESRVTISGCIVNPPEEVRTSEPVVFWPDHAQRPLQPLKISWKPSSANFIMTFAQARRMDGIWACAPAMALVCDSDKGK